VAIEDLDLEFEDETEIEKSDALDVDGDLDFSAHAKKNNGAQNPPPRRPAPSSQPRPQAKVQNISEARVKKSVPQSPQAKPQMKQSSQVAEPRFSPEQGEDYAYELDALRNEISELKELMGNVKNDADVKVAVAEAKSEFLIQYISDAKLLDHQVNQMLGRIHKKVPALKNDVLSIKKYLSDFLQKTKK
jgi:hypothetical protein